MAAFPRAFSSSGTSSGDGPVTARDHKFLAPLDLGEQLRQMRLRLGDFHDGRHINLLGSGATEIRATLWLVNPVTNRRTQYTRAFGSM